MNRRVKAATCGCSKAPVILMPERHSCRLNLITVFCSQPCALGFSLWAWWLPISMTITFSREWIKHYSQSYSPVSYPGFLIILLSERINYIQHLVHSCQRKRLTLDRTEMPQIIRRCFSISGDRFEMHHPHSLTKFYNQ